MGSEYNRSMQGENCHLVLVSTAAVSLSAAMTILDANFLPRPLKAWERLVVDDMMGNVSGGTADVLAAAAGTSTATSTNLICSFNTAVGLDLDTKEGIPLPVGITPSVLMSSSTATIKLTGNGRIVEGSTSALPMSPMMGGSARPYWKELSTPGGNF
jgi:hypothetical protein